MVPAVLDADELYRFHRTGDEEIRALRGVSLRVEAGETVAVMGPSGAGKSTLLACIAGLDEPSGGTVRIAGQRMSGTPEAARARLRAREVGLVLQTGNLISHLGLEQNIRLAQRIAGRRDPIEPLLRGVGLAHRRRALPGELSGGEGVRAAVAVALAGSPALVAADEPTGELDGEAEQQVLALLQERAGRGTALLLVTHSPRVAEIADRVIHLRDGRVAA